MKTYGLLSLFKLNFRHVLKLVGCEYPTGVEAEGIAVRMPDFLRKMQVTSARITSNQNAEVFQKPHSGRTNVRRRYFNRRDVR